MDRDPPAVEQHEELVDLAIGGGLRGTADRYAARGREPEVTLASPGDRGPSYEHRCRERWLLAERGPGKRGVAGADRFRGGLRIDRHAVSTARQP